MKRIRPILIILMAVAVGAAWVIACSPPKSEPVKTVTIPDGEYDPTVWGKAYPLEYDSWLKSKEPNPANLSKYKRGWTGDGKFDKLSEYPWCPCSRAAGVLPLSSMKSGAITTCSLTS